jgi:hypothetical protein
MKLSREGLIMNEEKNRQTEDLTKENEIIKAYIDATKTIAQESVKTVDKIATQYAEMAPGKKPSYAGIIFVITSVAIEFTKALSPKPIEFSDVVSVTLLIGGLVLMAAGTCIEAVLFYMNLKFTTAATEEAQKRLKELENEKASLFKRFIGH